MTQLEYNLSLKKELRFKNGKFRVLAFSDLHGKCNFDRRIIRDIAALLDKHNPDLILLVGDIVWDDGAQSPETLKAYLSEVMGEAESRRIPWAHVFGNHDAEKGYAVKDQQTVYESFEYCVAKRGPEDIYGTGNYVLPVKAENGNDIVFCLWGLDSNRNMHQFLTDVGLEDDYRQVMMPDPLHLSQTYDTIRFNRVMWYWNSSVELERYNGKKIPGMMFFHIPIPEFIIPYKNVAQTGYCGFRREQVGSSPINSGLFSAILQRGDVKTVLCGHDHINDYEGTYCGIKMVYDAGMSYDVNCDDDMQGGRIVDISEDDPWNVTTYMVRSADCVADYPGEEMRK